MAPGSDPSLHPVLTTTPVAPSGLPPRYEMGELLAAGGQGAVYRARDHGTGTDVVVKLIPLDGDVHAARFAREAAVLRMLDAPGVVRLLDSGRIEGQGWIVLAYVDGHRFPAGRTRWAELRDTTTALLDALAHLHERGLVHRDLKPANVLVGPSGSPTVLDFGLVRGAPAGATVTQTGAVMGTPRYMAPEQIHGARAEPRTDLYAVGLMLWEALTGRIPNDAPSVAALFSARLQIDPPSIRTLVPDLPLHVADTIDAMVARRVQDRPESARAALRALGTSVDATRFPWLGDRTRVASVAQRLTEGARCVIAGPRGAGRSRLLQEVASTLGGPQLWVGPGTMPLASLTAVLGAPEGEVDDPITGLRGALQARLDEGTRVFVDDLDRVDPWSRRVLAAVQGGVVVVADEPGAEALGPLPESAVRALFVGPERLLHLQSDAAALLWRRTGGLAARVVAEVDRWTSAGLARWEGEKLRIDRAAIERISAGFFGPPDDVVGDVTLPDDLDQMLAWIHLAGPECTVSRLAAARAEPRWQIDLAVEELVRRGAATRVGEILEPLRAARSLHAWHAESRQAAHAALAGVLPPGTPGRVAHLAAIGEVDALVDEALVVSARQLEDGRVSAAGATLREAAMTALLGAKAPRELWMRMTSAALLDGTRAHLTATLELLRRAGNLPDHAALVQIHLDAISGNRDDARAALETLCPFADRVLEQHRWELALFLARGEGGARYAETLAAASAWAEAEASDAALAAKASWTSSWHYQAGRAREAALQAEAGIARCHRADERLRLHLRAMSCWLEVGETVHASALGAELRRLGADRRLPTMEAYGEWVERSIHNRRRDGAPVDHDLVAAAEHLGAPEVTGVLLVTEATLAWRLGQLDLGAALAISAEAAFSQAGQLASAAWAAAVRVACRGSAHDAEVVAERLAATGRDDIIAEGLALLSATVGLDEPWRGVLEAAHARANWGERVDWPRGVLAPSEMCWRGHGPPQRPHLPPAAATWPLPFRRSPEASG